ncbi:MAG: DUF6668 family protein [Kineosporiaceae bacterium]
MRVLLAVPGPRPPQGPARGLPHRVTTEESCLWWVGVHGGAGESTWARLLPGSRAAGHAWPVPATPHLAPNRVVLVARTDLRGLLAVQAAAAQWVEQHRGTVDLLGLVLSADAPGRLPRPLADLAGHVSGGVPRVWRVPWLPAWRMYLPDEADVPGNGAVHRVLQEVVHLIPPRPSDPSSPHVPGGEG